MKRIKFATFATITDNVLNQILIKGGLYVNIAHLALLYHLVLAFCACCINALCHNSHDSFIYSGVSTPDLVFKVFIIPEQTFLYLA